MNNLNNINKIAIENLQQYLQIPSVYPNINYSPCVAFLQRLAEDLGLLFKVYTVSPEKPVVLITWTGTQPNLPSIFLNSHMDVVPVVKSRWTQNPFGANIVDGKIYARGAQDMKAVGIQYLEAIRRLRERKVSLKRTVHVCFAPDEEIGGKQGMGKFVETQDFEKLNIGFAMDEGGPSSKNEFYLFCGERYSWKINFHCNGESGHGLFLLPCTAGERAAFIMKKIYEFRDGEVRKLEKGKVLSDVITINVTSIYGGIQSNVIPAEIVIGVDVRIPPDVDAKQLEEVMQQWCYDAGDVELHFLKKETKTPQTPLDDSNQYWVAIKNALGESGIEVITGVCPGGTDLRYVRAKGIPGIGFSPINNTLLLLHGNDEYIGVETFLRGIEIYCNILTNIANT